MTWLSTILFAALAVVSVAFGWQPCCCGVVTACCSGSALPTTLHWVMSAPSCACLDGMTGTLVYGFIVPTSWSCGFTDLCASGGAHSEISFNVACNAGTGLMVFGVGEIFFGSTLGTAVSFHNPDTSNSFTITTNDCPPAFQMVISGTLRTAAGGFAAHACAGNAFTLTITV